MNNITEEMLSYMNAHELKQIDFAELMGVCPSAVSFWISGKRSPNTKNYLTFQKLKNGQEDNPKC